MAARVTVVDYEVGNLFSVCRALEHCGAEVILATDATAAARADRLVLPGVGAFGSCVEALRRRGLDAAVDTVVRAERPVLGICVGMQMLLDVGTEFGEHRGLGYIPGRVVRIPDEDSDGRRLKLPHINWAGIEPWGTGSWDGTPLAPVPPGASVYFVHSYVAVPDDPAHRLAVYPYHGHAVTAAVRRGNITGVQFHPERSARHGLAILEQFTRL